VWSCDQKHRASGSHRWVAAVANHGCGYLPRCAAYIDYTVERNCLAGCFPGLQHPAAGLVEEEVGVADEKLGFWLKMESNYPCLLNRNVAEKLQDAPGPEPCMELAAKHLPRILSGSLLDCLVASAEAKEEARCSSLLA
jgi:hypothetical protein